MFSVCFHLLLQGIKHTSTPKKNAGVVIKGSTETVASQLDYHLAPADAVEVPADKDRPAPANAVEVPADKDHPAPADAVEDLPAAEDLPATAVIMDVMLQDMDESVINPVHVVSSDYGHTDDISETLFLCDHAGVISGEEPLSSALRIAMECANMCGLESLDCFVERNMVADNYTDTNARYSDDEKMDFCLDKLDVNNVCSGEEDNEMQETVSYVAVENANMHEVAGEPLSLADNETPVTVDCIAPDARSRARDRKDPSSWKCSVRKRLRSSGLSYVSRSGVLKRRRILKPGCGTKCRKNCHQQISSNEREVLFHDFWKLGDLCKQREYLARHITQKTKKSKNKARGKRATKSSFQYTFVVSDKPIHVCKTFFLHTVDISDQIVQTTMNKLEDNGHLQPEKRSLPSAKKLPVSLVSDVMNHISKFPTVESHYCRKSSQKQYLPESLTLPEMYRLYSQECTLSGKPVAKKWAYYDIFKKKFNLGFHKPKRTNVTFV